MSYGSAKSGRKEMEKGRDVSCFAGTVGTLVGTVGTVVETADVLEFRFGGIPCRSRDTSDFQAFTTCLILPRVFKKSKTSF